MRNRADFPQPGLLAWFTGQCSVCDGPIVRGESRIVAKKGDWRHVGCVSGADDE